MTTGYTPVQSLPIPQGDEMPNVPLHMNNLALAVEKRLMAIYSTTAERDTKVAAGGAIEGQCAVITSTNEVYVYLDAVWKRIYPADVPTIRSGTTAPDNAVGVNGDVYLRY